MIIILEQNEGSIRCFSLRRPRMPWKHVWNG